MKTKMILALIVLSAITACNTSKTVTQTSFDKYKSIIATENKSVVYFVRPSVVGTVVPFRVFCNDSLIGSTTGNKYLFLVLKPNQYKFISKAENDAELELNVEPGKIYYIEQKPKMGIVMARNELILINDDMGRQKLEKCSLSSKFTPPAF